MKRIFALALLAIPFAASAQVLSTGTLSNNGSGGVFMNLTPTTQNLLVTGFSTQFGSAAGSAVSIEVWTRTGSYAGFTASNVGWTLVETASATSAGIAANAAFSLTNPIALTAGQTTAVYLHSITTGGGIRYNGTTAAPPTTTYSNSDLTMFTDTARTGAVSFAGTQFSPRAFSGDVRYSPVPEPASMAALGLGVAALLRRRKKSSV